jgi:hypothetical protein
MPRRVLSVFSILFVPYLGISAGIEPTTQQCIPGALAY